MIFGLSFLTDAEVDYTTIAVKEEPYSTAVVVPKVVAPRPPVRPYGIPVPQAPAKTCHLETIQETSNANLQITRYPWQEYKVYKAKD